MGGINGGLNIGSLNDPRAFERYFNLEPKLDPKGQSKVKPDSKPKLKLQTNLGPKQAPVSGAAVAKSIFKYAFSPLGLLAGCGDNIQSQGVPCENTVTVTDNAVKTQLQTEAALTTSNGNLGFKVKLRIKGSDNALVRGDKSPNGNLTLKIYLNNERLGIASDGKFTSRASTEAEYSACAEKTTSDCTPYSNTTGLVPIGMPKTNADGAIMLQSLAGNSYAVFGHMKDRTFGKNVYVYNDNGTNINVAKYVYTDWNAETEKIVWFRVDDSGIIVKADGSSVNSDKSVPKAADLIDDTGTPKISVITIADADVSGVEKNPAQAYYAADQDGKYTNTFTQTIDGKEVTIPVAESSLKQTVFKVMISDSYTLQDVIFGKKDSSGQWNPWGLAMDKDRKYDASLIGQKSMKYSVKLTDNLNKSNTQSFSTPVKMTGESITAPLSIDPSFHSQGSFDMTAELEFTGDLETLQKLAYIYSANFGVSARAQATNTEYCEQE